MYYCIFVLWKVKESLSAPIFYFKPSTVHRLDDSTATWYVATLPVLWLPEILGALHWRGNSESQFQVYLSNEEYSNLSAARQATESWASAMESNQLRIFRRYLQMAHRLSYGLRISSGDRDILFTLTTVKGGPNPKQASFLDPHGWLDGELI